MKHPALLLYLSAISLSSVNACMEFTGVFPFSHTAPFEARIVDNGVTTCWISTTLTEHNALQQEPLSTHPRLHKTKRSVGRKITLTNLPPYNPTANSPPHHHSLPSPSDPSPIDEKHIDLTTVPLPRGGHLPKTQKMEELDWEEIPAWQPWQFECISGYKARANVGMRGFTYVAHGQDFFFVPAMREDIWGEKWVYSLRLWCGEKDKKGKEGGEAAGAGDSGKKGGVEGKQINGGDGGKKESGAGRQSTAGKNGL